MVTGLIVVGILILFLLILITACYLWVSLDAASLIYYEAETIPFRKTALVLGTARFTSPGKTNRYFQYRMDAAAQLFIQKKSEVFIASGAEKFYEDIPEADEMKSALINLGIPAESIITDHAGYRTWDSLWRCRGSFGCHTITVVSQKFHVERAIFAGHKQGLNIIGLAAKRVGGRLATRMFIRECLARVKCVMDCYLLRPKPVYMRKMRRKRKPRK